MTVVVVIVTRRRHRATVVSSHSQPTNRFPHPHPAPPMLAPSLLSKPLGLPRTLLCASRRSYLHIRRVPYRFTPALSPLPLVIRSVSCLVPVDAKQYAMMPRCLLWSTCLTLCCWMMMISSRERSRPRISGKGRAA